MIDILATRLLLEDSEIAIIILSNVSHFVGGDYIENSSDVVRLGYYYSARAINTVGSGDIAIFLLTTWLCGAIGG